MTVFDLQCMDSDEIIHLFWRTNLREAFDCAQFRFDLENQYLVCQEYLTFTMCQNGKCSIIAKIYDPLIAYFKAWDVLQLFARLNHTKRGGSFSSCVQRWTAAEQFLLTETATLFIENKCWHLEAAGAAVGKRKGEVVSGGWEGGGQVVCFGECLWCYLTTVQRP